MTFGLATARLFIAESAQVAITGRNQKTLDEAIGKLGSSPPGYRLDVDGDIHNTRHGVKE